MRRISKEKNLSTSTPLLKTINQPSHARLDWFYDETSPNALGTIKENEMATEKRSLGMHPNLLYDVIMRQAGTLQKALLEGVMNAIDAGATECRLTLNSHRFIVEDNGRGIQTRQEIEDFFETFGTPHKEGDSVYGRFRMGRGQMMAFGRNIWRSRQFEMDVDVKNTGLDYMLTEHDEVLDGTRITAELYDPIAPTDLERTKGELRKFVAWAQIPVYLNGDLISENPADAKWSYEDDDAYYALSPERSQLAVYNLGVLVNHFHAGRFGVGGTIVSKKQVEVNFARNDVQSSCPVFKRVQNRIKKETGTAAKKKTKLTDAERDMLVNDFLAGELSCEDASKLRALTDVNGRSWQLNKLNQIRSSFSGRLLVAQRGDLLAETAQHRGIAFTVDEATLERFGVSDAESFKNRIIAAIKSMNINPRNYTRPAYDLLNMVRTLENDITIVDRDHLKNFVSGDHIALTNRELNAGEKMMMTAIASSLYTLVQAMNQVNYEDRKFTPRDFQLGRSETALAWTDGTRTVWMDVEHARLLRRGYAGAYQIALTLLHEMLHTGPDTGTHEHDHAFYQAFHDLSGHPLDPVGRAAERMISQFRTRLRQNGKKISAKLLAHDDVDLEIEHARAQAEDMDA